jgi:hypothetical protein
VAHPGVQVNGAGTPGLGGIRSEHERDPHDPFEVDEERAVDALRLTWGARYEIKACEGGYEAARREKPWVTLTGETPDELTRAMAEDSGSL